MRWFLVLLMLAIAAVVGVTHYLDRTSEQIDYLVDVAVQRDIDETVPVTGTAEPRTIHVVQSQVPGIVASIEVDFEDEVEVGQLLARLDDDVPRLQLRQAQYKLEAARAAVKRTDAELSTAEAGLRAALASLNAAKRDLEKASENAELKLIPAYRVDSARDLVRQVEAKVDAARSQVEQAAEAKMQFESEIKASELAVDLARVAVEKTELRSTLDGIVLERDLRVGDSVGVPRFDLRRSDRALFTIAAPLERMQAIVKISEADYGRIKVGQVATCTFDAFPDAEFQATVAQLRSSPDATDTAVNYPAVLEFENRRDPETGHWMVLPEATVSADILLRRVENVLAVPNAALLYTPERFDEEIPLVEGDQRLVWRLSPEGKPQHQIVRVGSTDGAYTEVLEVISGELEPGDEIIVGEPYEPETKLSIPIGG